MKTNSSKKKAEIIRKKWPKVRDLNPAGKKLFVVDARPHGRREGYATPEEALKVGVGDKVHPSIPERKGHFQSVTQQFVNETIPSQ